MELMDEVRGKDYQASGEEMCHVLESECRAKQIICRRGDFREREGR